MLKLKTTIISIKDFREILLATNNLEQMTCHLYLIIKLSKKPSKSLRKRL